MTGLFFLLAACRNPAPEPDPVWEQLVTWANSQRLDWGVPGIALALLRESEGVRTVGLGEQRLGGGAPVTPETVFRIGSVSKLFTGALVLQEAEAGRLDPDLPADLALPDLELADPHALADLTLTQLLSHSSGMQSQGLPNTCDLSPEGLGDVLAERVPDWNLWVPPGTLFQYAGPGFALAGHAAELSAGQPFAELVEERLLDPAGLSSGTYFPEDVPEEVMAAGHSLDAETGGVAYFREPDERACGATFPTGGLLLNITDLARVGELLLAEGSPWFEPPGFDKMTSPGWTMSETSAYGWGLVHMTYRDHRVWLHTGSMKGYQALLAVLPDEGAGVAVLVNSDHYVVVPPVPWSKPTQRIALMALDLLLGLPSEPLSSAARPVEEWDRYVGAYLSEYELGEVEVALVDETLWLTLPADDTPMALSPYGLDSFVYAYVGSDGQTYWNRINFEDDDSGQLTWLTSPAGIGVRQDP